MHDGTQRSFSQFLAEIEDGQLHHELTEALGDLVRVLMEHRPAKGTGRVKGTLNLSLTLTVDRNVCEVAGDFKVAKPRAPRGRSIFWPTDDGRLSRYDPRQQTMHFRDVNDAKTPKEIN